MNDPFKARNVGDSQPQSAHTQPPHQGASSLHAPTCENQISTVIVPIGAQDGLDAKLIRKSVGNPERVTFCVEETLFEISSTSRKALLYCPQN